MKKDIMAYDTVKNRRVYHRKITVTLEEGNHKDYDYHLFLDGCPAGSITNCVWHDIPGWQMDLPDPDSREIDFVDPESPDAYETADAVIGNLESMINAPYTIEQRDMDIVEHIRKHVKDHENNKTGEKGKGKSGRE